MNTKRFCGFGLPAVLLACGLMLAGCDTGASPIGGSPGTGEFSVSGSFTKTGIGDGVVNFDLKSNSAFGRAVTADSYTISGVLEDGDFTIRLNGSYDPNTGNWSVSAKSSVIIYTLDGSVDSAGVSRGSSATIAVKNDNDDEWVPYIFPVTEAAVSISGAAEAVEGETDGMPSFAHGYWYLNIDDDEGHSESMSAIVSAWKIKVTGTTTGPDGTAPFESTLTVIELTESDGSYGVIGCYPEYVMTAADLAEAFAAYLKIDAGDIKADLTEHPGSSGVPPSCRWVYVEGSISSWGGFSDAEFDKLDVFWATGGWETWAAAHSIPKANIYLKFKVSFTNGNTEFNMIPMAAVEDSSQPWEYTYDFYTLAELKAKTLVEVCEWEPEEGGDPTEGAVKVQTLHR